MEKKIKSNKKDTKIIKEDLKNSIPVLEKDPIVNKEISLSKQPTSRKQIQPMKPELNQVNAEIKPEPPLPDLSNVNLKLKLPMKNKEAEVQRTPLSAPKSEGSFNIETGEWECAPNLPALDKSTKVKITAPQLPRISKSVELTLVVDKKRKLEDFEESSVPKVSKLSVPADEKSKKSAPLISMPVPANKKPEKSTPLRPKPVPSHEKSEKSTPLRSKPVSANEKSKKPTPHGSKPVSADEKLKISTPLRSKPVPTNEKPEKSTPPRSMPVSETEKSKKSAPLRSMPQGKIPQGRIPPLTKNQPKIEIDSNKQVCDVPLVLPPGVSLVKVPATPKAKRSCKK